MPISDAMFIAAQKAAEHALSVAGRKPEFYDAAMQAHRVATAIIKQWDQEQIAAMRLKGKPCAR